MRSSLWLLLIPLLGCSLPEPVPPSAEFLLADGSSTYWVRSGPDGISARMSPLILTKADNRFYEVFVGEVVRSYEGAVFSREPIYRRDLLRGEPRLVYEDDRIAEWERRYLADHPDARLLDPDDDEAAEPALAASAEADILGVAGPYVLYDGRITVEREDFQRSDSSRGAVDIRSGATVPLAAMARDTALLGAGGVREGASVTWQHSGYKVVARHDTARAETQVFLRDGRGREWALGFVDSRLPRVFWLDEPAVDADLLTALHDAFDEASSEPEETQLVARRSRPRQRFGSVFRVVSLATEARRHGDGTRGIGTTGRFDE